MINTHITIQRSAIQSSNISINKNSEISTNKNSRSALTKTQRSEIAKPKDQHNKIKLQLITKEWDIGLANFT
jgi:hypothetical protein